MENINWICKAKTVNNNIVWMCHKDLAKVKEYFESTSNSVQLFTAANYGGNSSSFGIGRYTNTELQRIGPKALQSIKVPSGFQVLLYQNGDFTGLGKSIISDTPDLSKVTDSKNTGFNWSNQMQSLVVQPYTALPKSLKDSIPSIQLVNNDPNGFLVTVKGATLSNIQDDNYLFTDPANDNNVYWYKGEDLQVPPPFDVANIPGLMVWLDGADASSMKLSDSNVSQWNDKSGNGNHVTQTDSNFQPTLTKSFTNGLSAMNMGKQGYFRNTKMAIGAAPYSIFAVAIQNNKSAHHQYIIGLPNDKYLFLGSRDGIFATFSGNGGAWNDIDANTPPKSVKSLSVLGMINNSNTLLPYFNGVALDAKKSISASQIGFGIGAALGNNPPDQFWGGTICEILIYNNVLSKMQRQTIEGYLAWKWGIQSNLPGHLYASIPQKPFDLSSMGGLFLWLDGKDPLNNGSPPGDDSNMTTWNDKSGNGYNGNCNGSVKYNSKFGITINGTDSEYVQFPVKFPNGDTPYSMFFVAQYTKSGTSGYLFATGTGENGFLGIRSQNNNTFVTDWAGTWLNGQTPYTVNKSFIYSTHYQGGGEMAQYVNGSMDVNIIKPKAPKFLSYDFSVGVGSFPGHLSEIIVFTRCLSFNERQKVEGYLATKWGLQSNLQNNHAFKLQAPTLYTSLPFDISSIGGLELWLDSNDSSTLTLSGSNVTQWNDKSGNGNNFTVTPNFQPPTFKDTNSGINFVAKQVMISAKSATFNKNTTIFFVGKVSNDANYILSFTQKDLAFRWFPENKFGGNNQNDFNSENSGFIINGGSTTDPKAVLNKSLVNLNVQNGGSGQLTLSTDITYWGDRFFKGVMCELLIFNTPLTPIQIQEIQGYLSWKWGLQTNLPASHPFKNSAPSGLVPKVYPFDLKSVNGLQIWLDGMDPLNNGSTLADGTVVSKWLDKSGNIRDATSFGSPTISGNQISFNGSSQYFTLSYMGIHNIETGFIVVTLTNGGGTGILMGDAGAYIRQIGTWDNKILFCNFNVGCPVAVPYDPSAKKTVILEYIMDAFSTYLYINGKLLGSGASFGVAPENNIFIGASKNKDSFFTGKISEVIVYNKSLSVIERQKIEGYLGWKWNLNNDFPNNHPYKKSKPTTNNPAFDIKYLDGLQIWLDGMDPLANSTTPSDGTSIEMWKDKSGNGNDLKAKKPAKYATSSNSLNFNRSLYNSINSLVFPIDVYIIVKLNDTNGPFDVCSLDVNNGDDFNSLTFGENKRGFWQNGSSGGSRFAVASSNETSTDFLLMQWSLADNNFTINRNGKQIVFSNSHTWNKNPKYFQLGSRHFNDHGNTLVGSISEVIVLDKRADNITRQKIEGYLAWKWKLQGKNGLDGILPNNHLCKFDANPAIVEDNSHSFLTTEIKSAKLLSWFDANDINGNGEPLLDGQQILAWADKSGNGYHAQKQHHSPPIVMANALNGKNVLNLRGNTQFAFSFRQDITNYTIFTVQFGKGDYGNWQRLLHGGHMDADGRLLWGFRAGTDKWMTGMGNSGWTNLDSNQPEQSAGDKWSMADAVFNVSANTAATSFNGTPQNLRNNALAGFNGMIIGSHHGGGGQFWQGQVAEILVFNGLINDEERKKIQGYLAWKWGLIGNLPKDHPFVKKNPLNMTVKYDSLTQSCVDAVNNTGFVPKVTWGTTKEPVNQQGTFCDPALCRYFKDTYGTYDNVPDTYRAESDWCKSNNV